MFDRLEERINKFMESNEGAKFSTNVTTDIRTQYQTSQL